MMCAMSDKWRRVRVTGDQDGGGHGKWFAAWFAFCALLGLGLLGVLVWAVMKLVTRYAG
jgi:hypothetical protein